MKWRYLVIHALTGGRAMRGKVLVLAFGMAVLGLSFEAKSRQKVTEESESVCVVEKVDAVRPSSDREKESFKKQNLYSPLQTKTVGANYEMRGTIYLSDQRDLTNIEAQADTQISIEGTITRVEGEVKILYKDSSRTIITLADSQDSTEQLMAIDTDLDVKKGRGEIYFSGSCIYDFDIKLETSEDLKYYLN